MPAPQSQASARWLLPRQGRSGWFSQTQPVLSQTKHAISDKYAADSFIANPTGRHREKGRKSTNLIKIPRQKPSSVLPVVLCTEQIPKAAVKWLVNPAA
jgi:hypothetical protein